MAVSTLSVPELVKNTRVKCGLDLEAVWLVSFSATRPASSEHSMRTRFGALRDKTCSRIDRTRG